jgi:hypothetical protein
MAVVPVKSIDRHGGAHWAESSIAVECLLYENYLPNPSFN